MTSWTRDVTLFGHPVSRRGGVSNWLKVSLAMKRLFAKATKSSPLWKPSSSSTPPSAGQTTSSIGHTPHLNPKYTVPPTPHPLTDHIALLATSDGLLLRPQTIGVIPDNYAKIAWGRQVQVIEQAGDGDDAGDWSESVVVYGIVGVLELLEGM